MTKPQTILQAGRQIAAIASGRAFKEDTPEEQAKELLNAPNLERPAVLPPEPEHSAPETKANKRAAKECQTEPGNPNQVNHNAQMPEQL